MKKVSTVAARQSKDFSFHSLRIAGEPESPTPWSTYSIPLYSRPLIPLRPDIATLEALRHPKSRNSLGVLQLSDHLGHCGYIVENRKVGVAGEGVAVFAVH